MRDPIESLHTAIRSKLIVVPELMALIAPERIRAGVVRAEAMPCLLLGTPSVEIMGRAARNQTVAGMSLVLHVWGTEEDAERTQQIAALTMQALMDAPAAEDFSFDAWHRPAMTWVRDPQPERASLHAVIDLSCVIRWRN